jgi:diadenosine tetraphosphatase ApaH/serine/threonine PP2A family protein phosphatase
MRVAIISDVHSNLEALFSVFKDIHEMGVERVYCLGDVVGYAAHPEVCLDFLLGEPLVKGFIVGNHDHYVVNFQEELEEIETFVNKNALAGLRHSRKRVSLEHLSAMASWPEKMVVEDLGLSLAHGSFSYDHYSRYIPKGQYWLVDGELRSFSSGVCVVGHTHDPYVYKDGDWFSGESKDPILVNGRKLLINVGSVGQPRDGDPRACYGLFIFEKETSFQLRRVAYDIDEAVRHIKMVGLPPFLGKRLKEGK